MPNKLKLTTLSFHIIAAAFILFMIAFLVQPEGLPERERFIGDATPYMYALFCLLFAVWLEYLIFRLKQLRKWARIVSIAFAIFFFITPIFVILGALALWGLFAKDTKKAFGVVRLHQVLPPGA